MPEQTEQSELECVSCDSTFDPAPTGGFCPDCDTPHPDFGVDEEDADGDDADETADADAEADESASDDAAADVAASFCPDCGADLSDVGSADGDASDGLGACPDCGHSVTDESYCPNCGTDLDAARAEADDADDESADEEMTYEEAGADDEDAEADETDDESADAGDDEATDEDDADAEDDADDSAADPITLVIDGESYGFGDGDTFGRQDEAWLEALVNESGGSDDVAYISSDHLEFSVDDDGVTVRDASRNGTKLNGTDLDGDETELSDGDTLELAERAEITVELDEEA